MPRLVSCQTGWGHLTPAHEKPSTVPSRLAPSHSEHKVYTNSGNPALIEMLGRSSVRVLDIGCGAGDNARLIKQRNPESKVFGVTKSPHECELARQHMEHCWVFDIEHEFPAEVRHGQYDALIFSHVLEHLRKPTEVLTQFLHVLQPSGELLIAVPNVAYWRQRIRCLRVQFEYEPTGILDDTHLRFYTYFSAERQLLSHATDLTVSERRVTGDMPLWPLRRYVLSSAFCSRIDAWCCRQWPNLCGWQILLKATRQT